MRDYNSDTKLAPDTVGRSGDGMMSTDLIGPSFTHREDGGEFLISVQATVHDDFVVITYSTSEYDAELTCDNILGLERSECFTHPSFIANFIKKIVGEGEVKFHYHRRSDELARLLEWERNEKRQLEKAD